jgi:hypothetical protein
MHCPFLGDKINYSIWNRVDVPARQPMQPDGPVRRTTHAIAIVNFILPVRDYELSLKKLRYHM